MRRRKPIADIKGPFTIVVDRASDGIGWIGKIIGLPCGTQVTCADTPEVVAYMAWDILRLVTGRCDVDRPEHAYTIDTMIGDTPAWGCENCDLKTIKTAFIEDDDTVH